MWTYFTHLAIAFNNCGMSLITNLLFSFLAASTAEIEEFFLDTASQYIRRFFPPSFAFKEFDVNGKGR